MKKITNNKNAYGLLAIIASLTVTTSVHSASVALQNATATFSQTFNGDFTVGRAINGTFAENLGWSVVDATISDQTNLASAQTAVFETAVNIGFAGGSLLTFNLYQTHGIDFAKHTIGRFRLSVTTDDRSLFADGLHTGGDVTANWTVLDPSTFLSANGAILSKQGDFSLLASGASPDTDIYTVTALTALTGITGIRLEVLEDPSLPFNGPGRQPLNGNFELSEFTVDINAVPEPTSLSLLIAGGLILSASIRSRKNLVSELGS
jgi:hypothetical protein